MEIVADLHIHTVASGHAVDTLRTICEVAAKKRLQGIAITDHGPAIPGGANKVYFMTLTRFTQGIDTPLRVIAGIEDDICSKRGDLTLAAEFLQKLEIITAGCHPYTWMAEQSLKGRTVAMVNAITRKNIQVVTHPVGAFYPLDLDAVVDACVHSKVALELNTSKLSERDQTRSLLEKCAKYEAAIVVNSDAHIADEIGRFSDAVALLLAMQFPEHLVINRSKESIADFFGIEW
jgi:putative hydrolase